MLLLLLLLSIVIYVVGVAHLCSETADGVRSKNTNSLATLAVRLDSLTAVSNGICC